MTLKAEPSRMSPIQTAVVLLVGASAVLWGFFGLMDYNAVAELLADYQQVQTVVYIALGGAGGVFLLEIFTTTELLNILD